MGQKIVYYCDCCKKESLELPENWGTILVNDSEDGNSVSVCSLECFIKSIDTYGRILEIVPNMAFFKLLSTEYVVLSDERMKLQEQLQKGKIKAVEPEKSSRGGGTTPVPEKPKGRFTFTDEQRTLVQSKETFKEALSAFRGKWPQLGYVEDKQVRSLWYSRTQTAKVSKQSSVDKKNERNMLVATEVRSEPLQHRQVHKEDTRKPEPPNIVKSFYYYVEDRNPEFEKVMLDPFMKSDLAMESMKDVWSQDRRIASSGLQMTEEVSDGPFLYYKGYYQLWVVAASVNKLMADIPNKECLVACD